MYILFVHIYIYIYIHIGLQRKYSKCLIKAFNSNKQIKYFHCILYEILVKKVRFNVTVNKINKTIINK